MSARPASAQYDALDAPYVRIGDSRLRLRICLDEHNFPPLSAPPVPLVIVGGRLHFCDAPTYTREQSGKLCAHVISTRHCSIGRSNRRVLEVTGHLCRASRRPVDCVLHRDRWVDIRLSVALVANPRIRERASKPQRLLHRALARFRPGTARRKKARTRLAHHLKNVAEAGKTELDRDVSTVRTILTCDIWMLERQRLEAGSDEKADEMIASTATGAVVGPAVARGDVAAQTRKTSVGTEMMSRSGTV